MALDIDFEGGETRSGLECALIEVAVDSARRWLVQSLTV